MYFSTPTAVAVDNAVAKKHMLLQTATTDHNCCRDISIEAIVSHILPSKCVRNNNRQSLDFPQSYYTTNAGSIYRSRTNDVDSDVICS